MPAPIVPPPANDTGALIQPRTLQRWLDVNRITKLDRTQTFVTIPSFSQSVTWSGYSDIVAAFNYEGPNNISFKSFTIPTNPNYLLCVMWRDANNITHRYKFWSGIGEVLYFDIPVYAGQIVEKNFRFEIWSTNSTPAVQSTSVTIYTSKLNDVDYRYGNDTVLVTNDAEVTNFGLQTTVYTPPTTNGSFFFSATQGLDINSTWTDQFNNYVLTRSGTVSLVTTPFPYVISTAGTFSGTIPLTTLRHFFFLVATEATLSSPIRLKNSNVNTLLMAVSDILGIKVSIPFISSAYTPTIGDFYIVEIEINNGGNNILNVYDPSTLTLLGTSSATYGTDVLVNTIIVPSSSGSAVIIVLGYTALLDSTNVNSVLQYINQYYNNAAAIFNLPLTFPVNSSPQPN